jgi:hypothetical protein
MIPLTPAFRSAVLKLASTMRPVPRFTHSSGSVTVLSLRSVPNWVPVRRLVKHSSQVLGVLIIVQLRCCPAVIVPVQSPINEVVKLGDLVSVTLNAPAPNVT